MTENPSPVITIDQQRYYIQAIDTQLPAQLAKSLNQHPSDFVPITAVAWTNSSFGHEDLKGVCDRYLTEDDVWNSSFLSFSVLLIPSGSVCKVTNKNTFCIETDKSGFSNGPFVIEKVTGQVFKVFKLVRDTHHAFLSALVPYADTRSSFREFPEQDELEIALPSRLYYQKSASKLFAGLRIAVKDTIALKGLSTGYGSKAWRELYRPKEQTAPCVQLLLEAGAVIVGKVKSSELAEGVDPSDWTEGVCPYNPRGDGHQKPSSSSTGSASATAAYAWLDLAYGTDTGGSIRHPAGVQGVFGLRPTQGKIDMTDVLGATELWDTVGILARDVGTFTGVGSYLINPNAGLDEKPRRRKYRLLYATRPSATSPSYLHNKAQKRWFPRPESDLSAWTEAERQVEAVIAQMEVELNCVRIPFNVDELWDATHPSDQPRSLDEATGFIYGVITTSSACQNGVDQFIEDYAAAHDGQRAPISELVGRRMDYGRRCSKAQIAAALEASAAFAKWVLNTLFGPVEDDDTTTLLVFPQSQGVPDYREDAPDNTELFKEFFSIYSFAYLAGCPDYTVPIGEVAFKSRMTQKIGFLPVSLSFVGRPGTDPELLDILDHLHRKGVIADVAAGNRMYPDRKA